MAEIFTTIGVVVIVFGALLFVSWFIGKMIGGYDWELPAWMWSVVISTIIISAGVLHYILKVF